MAVVSNELSSSSDFVQARTEFAPILNRYLGQLDEVATSPESLAIKSENERRFLVQGRGMLDTLIKAGFTIKRVERITQIYIDLDSTPELSTISSTVREARIRMTENQDDKGLFLGDIQCELSYKGRHQIHGKYEVSIAVDEDHFHKVDNLGLDIVVKTRYMLQKGEIMLILDGITYPYNIDFIEVEFASLEELTLLELPQEIMVLIEKKRIEEITGVCSNKTIAGYTAARRQFDATKKNRQPGSCLRTQAKRQAQRRVDRGLQPVAASVIMDIDQVDKQIPEVKELEFDQKWFRHDLELRLRKKRKFIKLIHGALGNVIGLINRRVEMLAVEELSD